MGKKIAVPQIKICGLTNVDEAIQCADLGANAIGFVFYPKSPRFVSDEIARDISNSVAGKVKTVGVFVNETYEHMMQKIEFCSLSAVQLHGQESPALVEQLRKENIAVIKTLFIRDTPSFGDIQEYDVSAYLVEYAQGPLPGGNALAWPWQQVSPIGRNYPLVLAGGLNSDNVAEAIIAALPNAIDVSSGVEQSPGKKDLKKVSALTDAVAGCASKLPPNHRWDPVF
jgi:phosphoribosylanthranilate isomerase